MGHLGRLAPEKNLAFLTEAVCAFLQRSPTSHFLLAGYGPSEEFVKRTFERVGLANRLHITGQVSGETVVNTYHAMDVFVFASKSETQGMVLVEAMAAGVPVIALDAPGVREVVDHHNGRLLAAEDQTAFAAALSWFISLSNAQRNALQQGTRATAERFSTSTCTDSTLTLYRDVMARKRAAVDIEDSTWMRCIRVIE